MTTSELEYTHNRFASQKNIWFATVKKNGQPHLVPVWFVWFEDKIYVCIEPTSVKAKNLDLSPFATLAIEDASKPIICECRARIVPEPWQQEIFELFEQKYDWDIEAEEQYTQLIEATPLKWLAW